MPDKDPLFYEVPGVQLIVQDMNMACWYASAMMLLNWIEKFRVSIFENQCTVADQTTINLYKANNGVQNAQILPLAKRLGLVSVPPQTPTHEALKKWLVVYGPLWTNGTKHIVVIAGIRTGANGDVELKVFDPWPGQGVNWRSMYGWYEGFNSSTVDNATRDTGGDVQAVFLHAR